jgi:23S rRNA-/tRNA-specific pseudouridylate synthase
VNAAVCKVYQQCGMLPTPHMHWLCPSQLAGANCAAARLRDSLLPTSAIGALHKPTPCHRLDLPTCGLLLAAKTKQARYTLQHAFEAREVEKR